MDFPGRLSLPVRGAWVEMRSTRRSGCRRTSRSPCGERGLKYSNTAQCVSAALSLPVRGAWVEIF